MRVAAVGAMHGTAPRGFQIGHAESVRPVDRMIRRGQDVLQRPDRAFARALNERAVLGSPRDTAVVRGLSRAEETQHGRKDRLALADDLRVGGEPGVERRASGVKDFLKDASLALYALLSRLPWQ